MCGILVTAALNRPFSHRSLKSLRARGPDAVGFWTDERINVGYTRLAIIGLHDRAIEPFENERFVLAFNGEIYNFDAIRRRLDTHADLTGANDGEVLLHAWERWGPEILTELVGFWAFVVYDKVRQRLFLVRDQLGIKPLYYWISGKKICVSSMIKTIRDTLDESPALNYEAMSEYAAYQFTFSDHTFFEGVKKVRPGHVVEIDVSTGGVSTSSYEDILAPTTEPRQRATAEWIDETWHLLTDCVLESTISDTSFTTLCSGGIDSSLVTRIAAPQLAFHGNYSDPECNETFFARQVVEGTETRLYVVNAREDFNLVDSLKDILTDFDELSVGSVVLPLDDVLAQVKRRHKVVLSGTGGDELFGGYVRYQLAVGECYQDSYKGLFGRMQAVRSIADRFELTHRKGHTDYFRFYDEGVEDTFRKSFEDCKVADDDLHAMLTFDRRYFLPGLLNIDDKMAARHSLECRPSLLHQRLVRHVNQLEPADLFAEQDLKSVLRDVASGVVPKSVVRRVDKMGFTTPIGTFVRRSSEDIREQLTNSPFRELYNFRQLNFSARDKFSREVFGLLMLDLWLNEYA